MLIPVTLVMAASLSGCGLLLGGDQKVDNKSHDYTVVRLDREANGEWRFLAPVAASREQQESGASKDEAGDVAFEHTKTGAIISLNSVCREYREASLEELSKYLLMGLNTKSLVERKDIDIDGVKGLESNVEATMNQRAPSGERADTPVKVRTIVLRKNGCTYDLMYVARPDVFDHIAPAFERFLKGFHAE